MKPLFGALALLITPLSSPAGDRFELTVFGGLSVVNASVSEERGDVGCPGDLEPGRSRNGCLDFVRTEHTSLGASFLQGAGLAYRIGARSSLELSFGVAPSHGLNHRIDTACSPQALCDSRGVAPFRKGFVAQGQPIVAYYADMLFRYAPAQGDTRPFLSAGFGWIEYDGPPEADWTAIVGGGLDLKLGERLHARIEALDHVMTGHFLTEKTEHNVQARIGLIVRP